MKHALVWESVGLSMIALYSIVAGYSIIRGNPRGRSIARHNLVISLLAFIGIEVIALLILSGGDLPQRVMNLSLLMTVRSVFQELAFVVTWGLYFSKSKRVRHTYGEDSVTDWSPR